MLVTRAFEKLASVVASGSKLPDLNRYVLPHPLNPLPDDQVRAITREHLNGMVSRLVAGGRA